MCRHSFQQFFAQVFFQRVQPAIRPLTPFPPIPDQRRRSTIVTAAAEFRHDLRNINRIAGRACHDTHTVLRGSDHEERIGIEQIAQFVRQRGNFLVHIAGITTGNHNPMPMDLMSLYIVQQLFIEQSAARLRVAG